MKLVRGTTRWTAGLLLLLAMAGCSKLIDHNASRCDKDSDCLGYSHYHPFCVQHVCVQSGLAPEDCFYPLTDGPLSTPENFLNQCSMGFLPGGPDGKPGTCLVDGKDPTTFDAGIRMPPPRGGAPASTSMHPAALCRDLAPPGTTVVYMSGSSNFQPLLAELAPAIADTSPPIVPVFKITTSCIGAHSMNPDSPTFNNDHYIKDPGRDSAESYAQIFLGNTQGGIDCLLGTDGEPVAVGESEIYPESCEGPANKSDTVSESVGPILPLLFIVPPGSHETAISFETARQVFGGGGGVYPWLDPARLFVRGNGTATLRLLAKELELTPAQVWGVDQGNAVAMAQAVGVTSDPVQVQSTIGIIGIDFYDLYRGSLKPLAFQAKGQKCAYVPDSSLSTHDRINVRDGHYPLWGRIHFYTQIKDGNPVSQAAQDFVFRLTNANLDKEILTAFIKAGFVPTCAMKVKRTGELSDLLVDSPPPHACGCVFDKFTSLNGAAPETCHSCTDNGQCTEQAPNIYCNYGYCEPTL
ncbi:MAG TPA: hypothetical protein VFH68_01270 [Polyangia bacterium]|jgi:hypothetical protein|nr:hypothetical protein [Polyangia bacterium]